MTAESFAARAQKMFVHLSCHSLSDNSIDTPTASGGLTFNVFSSLARFERGIIRKHTQARLLPGLGVRSPSALAIPGS